MDSCTTAVRMVFRRCCRPSWFPDSCSRRTSPQRTRSFPSSAFAHHSETHPRSTLRMGLPLGRALKPARLAAYSPTGTQRSRTLRERLPVNQRSALARRTALALVSAACSAGRSRDLRALDVVLEAPGACRPSLCQLRTRAFPPTVGRDPSRGNALMCTKSSRPPSAGAMKPKPRSSCHVLSIPVRRICAA